MTKVDQKIVARRAAAIKRGLTTTKGSTVREGGHDASILEISGGAIGRVTGHTKAAGDIRILKGMTFDRMGGTETESIVDLFGGGRVFSSAVSDPLDAHQAIMDGFPLLALTNLVQTVGVIQQADFLEKAIGISARTLQRRKADDPDKLLSLEQSSRTWKFAEIVARATRVFGSQIEAEQWLSRPAIGLNQLLPIDLLATTAGVEIVEDHLARLEFGVYA